MLFWWKFITSEILLFNEKKVNNFYFQKKFFCYNEKKDKNII
jgi:hypothetical protein